MQICNMVYGINVSVFQDEKIYEEWYQKMPSERRKLIDAFKPMPSKYLSLGAGIVLLRALNEQGIVNPLIEAAESGKPYLVDEDGAFFNLSHSGEMAVCAFSDEEVGIDIERNKEFSDSLIGYVFDDREKKFICDRAGSEEERNVLYTSLWTVKESLMKYNGQGLSMDPKTIFIDMENDYRAYHKGQECENLFFTRLKCDDYQICVCSTYKDFTDEIIKVDVI